MANRWKQWKKIVCHLASASSAQELVHWASLVVLLRCPPELCTLVAPAPTIAHVCRWFSDWPYFESKGQSGWVSIIFLYNFPIIFPSLSQLLWLISHDPSTLWLLVISAWLQARTRRLQRRPRPAAEAQELSETWRIQKWDISMGYFFGIFLWDIFMGYFYWIFLWDILYGIFLWDIFMGYFFMGFLLDF